MKEIFQYTFSAISEYKKLSILGILISVLSFLEMYPVISIVAYIFEKIVIFSVGAILIYLIIRSKDADDFYDHIKLQPVSTFLFHFLPTAMGIVLGNLILIAVFAVLLFIALYFTNAMGILMMSPHSINPDAIPTMFLIDLIIITIYFFLISYIYLGKLGNALAKDNFKESFLEIISVAIDYKYLKSSFNLKYFAIYFVWSLIIFLFYSFSTFVFNLYIYPQLRLEAGSISPLIFIVVLSFGGVIISYFTFISAYFANKSIK